MEGTLLLVGDHDRRPNTLRISVVHIVRFLPRPKVTDGVASSSRGPKHPWRSGVAQLPAPSVCSTMFWLVRKAADDAKIAAKKILKDEVREWREICAAIDLEEQRLKKESEQRLASCTALCIFWHQNLFGLVIESPIRTTYHFLCSAGWCAVQPCFLFKPDSPAAKCSAHHYLTVQEYYYFLQHVLCANVQRPQPASLYLEDYRINRPPRPRGAWSDSKPSADSGDCCSGGCCSCSSGDASGGDCCNDICNDCCKGLEFFLMREVKSLLCVFSCASSLHPGRCCGPPPIQGCYETIEQRHERWTTELEEARQARTDAFIASYRREDYTFSGMKASRRLVAHRVASGVPIPAGAASVPAVAAPKQQDIVRV
jgi:hypothetical protein